MYDKIIYLKRWEQKPQTAPSPQRRIHMDSYEVNFWPVDINQADIFLHTQPSSRQNKLHHRLGGIFVREKENLIWTLLCADRGSWFSWMLSLSWYIKSKHRTWWSTHPISLPYTHTQVHQSCHYQTLWYSELSEWHCPMPL